MGPLVGRTADRRRAASPRGGGYAEPTPGDRATSGGSSSRFDCDFELVGVAERVDLRGGLVSQCREDLVLFFVDVMVEAAGEGFDRAAEAGLVYQVAQLLEAGPGELVLVVGADELFSAEVVLDDRVDELLFDEHVRPQRV